MSFYITSELRFWAEYRFHAVTRYNYCRE